ncbi:MAG TPA: UbiD family decarboxylase [Acidobacteriota bacterium]|nr:UbiD family decarboxylase [Acidobacteriota bacterium]
MGFANLQDYLREVDRRGLLRRVRAPVDPYLEIAEIHRRVIAAGGPVLLFENVQGSSFPVVTNLFGSQERIDLAFGEDPKRFVEFAARAPEELLPPKARVLWKHRGLLKKGLHIGLKRRSAGAVTQSVQDSPRLSQLPLLTSWIEDGGPFVTLPLVYTEDPDSGQHNLGMYRIQQHSDSTTGIHWQIGKGGGFHYHKAEERGEPLPLTLFIGGPPALILAAIAPLPENVPELMLASLLQGKRLTVTDSPHGHPHPLVAEAEFALQGHVPPHERLPEGPFGDHYGYYSLRHDYPVFHVDKVYHRKEAIYPATVVGKPRQEDFYIGDYLQDLLSPLFPLVMPGVVDLWSYGETGYHALSAAVLRERYGREAMASAFRILGEGQLSLTKFLLALDRPMDLNNFPAVLTYILERADFSRDLYVFSNLSMDTLDYSGPEVNKGSKGILLGLGEKRRELPGSFSGSLPRGVRRAETYIPGCLVLEGQPYDVEPGQAQRLTEWDDFSDFPLLIVVDDSRKTVATHPRFLWTVFTRFEPAGDICSRKVSVQRHHLGYTPPICIDARIKPHYPEELFCDPDTAKTVSQRWGEYFPEGGVEMGDSDVANL